jgi:ADP-heptose:LPS heptosyltransferase
VPALRALRRHYPEHRIVLAAPAVLAPLAALSGAVDEVADVGPLEPVPARLHGADVAVNLHGRGPRSTGLLAATRPRRLIAWDGTWRADEHEVARWCRLLAENGIPADPADLRLPAPRGRPAPRARLVIHPGAASAARRWPVERFAAVAREIDGVVVTAGPGEEALAARVGAPVLTGLALLDLAAVIASAGAVLCGDTGVSHLATAMGTPSLTLFGPTPPGLWGPPAGDPRHRVIWRGREGDPHASRPDPGLTEIGVSDVMSELGYLLPS